MAKALDVIVITGLSGSGKGHAIHSLEDSGFFCIDNLPVVLIPKFIDLCQGYRKGIQKIALGIDLRVGQFFQDWPHVLAEIREAGHHLKVLFFDARDEILLRRFGGTRRPHPLAGGGPIQEGITKERKALEGMRALAGIAIDTSDFNVHELKRAMENYYSEIVSARTMTFFPTSFGYKFGIPHDTDMIVDVRFLPDPFFIGELRGKSGLESEVRILCLNARKPAFFWIGYVLSWTLPSPNTNGRERAPSRWRLGAPRGGIDLWYWWKS